MTEEEKLKGFFDGTIKRNSSELTPRQRELFKEDFLAKAKIVEEIDAEVFLQGMATRKGEPFEVPPGPERSPGMEGPVQPCAFHDLNDLENILAWLEGDGSTFMDLAETIKHGDEGESTDALTQAYREFSHTSTISGWYYLMQLEYQREMIESFRPESWDCGNIEEKEDSTWINSNMSIEIGDFLRDWVTVWASAFIELRRPIELLRDSIDIGTGIEVHGDSSILPLGREAKTTLKKFETTQRRLNSAVHMGLLCIIDRHFWLDGAFVEQCSLMADDASDLARGFSLVEVVKSTTTTTTSTTTTLPPSLDFAQKLRNYISHNSGKIDLSNSSDMLNLWRENQGFKEMLELPAVRREDLGLIAEAGRFAEMPVSSILGKKDDSDTLQKIIGGWSINKPKPPEQEPQAPASEPPTPSPDALKVAEKIAECVVKNGNGDGDYCTQLDVRHFLGYNLRERDPNDGSKKAYSAAWKHEWVHKQKTKEGKAAGKLILENWEKLFAPDGKPNKNSQAVTLKAAEYLLEHWPSKTRQQAKLDI